MRDHKLCDTITGTGTFIVRLLQSGLIRPEDLARKYASELHANEILLLAYYIAAVNIEATYHQLVADDGGSASGPGAAARAARRRPLSAAGSPSCARRSSSPSHTSNSRSASAIVTPQSVRTSTHSSKRSTSSWAGAASRSSTDRSMTTRVKWFTKRCRRMLIPGRLRHATRRSRSSDALGASVIWSSLIAGFVNPGSPWIDMIRKLPVHSFVPDPLCSTTGAT